ncbi:MAG: ABC transporter substrate-binding protein [Corynebacterium sp.]|nr:ABC transporter substrate-binding protein [Corynebacterium sp.]
MATIAVVCALSLVGCGVQGAYQDSDAKLREAVASNAKDLKDPRTFTGVTAVNTFDEVQPVTDNAKPNLPVSLQDADGYEVEVTDVSRILPLDLYGTYSKTLTGLGLGKNIVGRTVSSTEESLKDLPVVTQGGHNINVEAVLQLDPTFVIVDHSIGPREAIDQIREAGVTVVVMEPKRTIEGVSEDIKNVADVVGLSEEGDKLAKRTEDEIVKDKEAIKGLVPAEPMRMAFVYARGTGGVFFILGNGTGSKDLIEGVGGIDLASENNLDYTTPANAESLARINPEVIIMMEAGLESTGGIEGLMQRPGIAQTTAGQKQRIVTLPDGQSLAFGPLTGQTLLRLAQAIYAPDKANS